MRTPDRFTSPVRITTTMPDGTNVETEIGSITIDVAAAGVDDSQIRRALGALLTEAGALLLVEAELADFQGVGESKSPD